MPEARRMKPVVEVLGPWPLNKGDDLMLRAVVNRLGKRCTLADSTPFWSEVPRDRRLARLVWRASPGQLVAALRSRRLLRIARLVSATLLSFLPRNVLDRAGFVDGRRVSVLLDCSGFAYSDQWNPARLRQRLSYYTRLKRRGVTLIMLPQALGPFRLESVRPHARALLAMFDLVYARDRRSAEHAAAVGLGPDELEVCPDITHLLPGKTPADSAAWERRVCVVPNARMLDRTSTEVSDRYLGYVRRSLSTARELGLEPCLVLHEANDDGIVREITAGLDFPVQVYDDDPAEIKGYLGTCYANIGSRYHSLVSSLSQSTPSLGTSWSHKYEELFTEYECRDLVSSPGDPDDEIDRKLRDFLAPARRQAERERLKPLAARQKARVEAMWERVERLCLV